MDFVSEIEGPPCRDGDVWVFLGLLGFFLGMEDFR